MEKEKHLCICFITSQYIFALVIKLVSISEYSVNAWVEYVPS